jgi:preprotein translocase subunit SecA
MVNTNAHTLIKHNVLIIEQRTVLIVSIQVGRFNCYNKKKKIFRRVKKAKFNLVLYAKDISKIQ